VPGVNHLKAHGRWAFAELTNIFEMSKDFADRGRGAFDRMIQAPAKEANP
jgi:type III restriction enzyme